MHILIDYRPALRQRTGVGEYVHNLTAALLPQLRPSERVTLFSSSWKDRLSADVLPAAARFDARIPVSLLNAAWHRLEWPPVEVLGPKPDVTWSLHPLLMPTRQAAQVVTVADLFFLDGPHATAREIRRDYAALAADHTRRADAVVAISNYTADGVATRLGVPRERIAVCYPGAPAWRPRPVPSAAGPIVHLGTVEPRKNIPALLRGYARLAAGRADVPPLVLAGTLTLPVESLFDERSSTIADRVQFRGYVSDDEKQRLLREASMLVLMSMDEGFGIPIVEAMSLGVPVVASSRGSLPEVAGDAAVLVDPDREADVADAMARVLSDGALRNELSARGPIRARTFNWDDSAKRLLDTFRTVDQAKRARR